MPLVRSLEGSIRSALVLITLQSLVSCSNGSEQPSGNSGANTEISSTGGRMNAASSGGTTVKGGEGGTKITPSGTDGTGGSNRGKSAGGASSLVANTVNGGASSSTPRSSTKPGSGGTSTNATGSHSAQGSTQASLSTGGANQGGANQGGASQGGASTVTSSTSIIANACGKDGAKCRIMPLGDSITGSTCYPQLISKGLLAAGRNNFEFVGKVENNQSCGATKVMTEGHGGYGVTYLPENSERVPFPCTKQSQGCGSFTELQSWATQKPDLVLMHYGTNDVWDGQSPAQILSAYEAVIHEFRAQNPNVIFFVSKIIKMSPSGCGTCLANVGKLAAAVTETWASTNSTGTSPIVIVDNYASTFDPTNSADTTDGVHPTQAGAQKSADVTVQALLEANYF